MAKKKEETSNQKISKGCQKHEFTGKLLCDNHADVYVGTKSHLTQFVASQDYPNSMKFSGEAKCCDYIYFVCWSDDIGLNGLLAEVNGNNSVLTGASYWEVFATGIDKDDKLNRPSPSQVNNQIQLANNNSNWLPTFTGSNNIGEGKPFSSTASGFSSSAKFIWHNSGKDSGTLWPASPYVPFDEFNHQEFLIFRFPANKMFIENCKECDCCEETPLCNTACSDCTVIEESILTSLKNEKTFDIPGKENSRICASVTAGEPCRQFEIPKIRPCFYFHWGDSRQDKIESHDTEIAYITVCNPYGNIGFKGLTILNIEILPVQPLLPNGEPAIQIAPSKLISFNCLDACSCASREFALITRGAKAQNYTINVEYCIDEIILKDQNKGKTSFGITLIDS